MGNCVTSLWSLDLPCCVEGDLLNFFSKMNCGAVEHTTKRVCVCSYTEWLRYQPPHSFGKNICAQHRGRSATESGGESLWRCLQPRAAVTELSACVHLQWALARAQLSELSMVGVQSVIK